MQLLIYCLVFPILWSISRLPWRVFYLFSTCIYIFTYYIIGYRKKTVTENLELIFPEKPKKEIYRIRKAFYKHMCDMFLEMIKSMSITNKELLERFKITNIDTYRELEAQQKSIVILMAHYASYEWCTVTQLLVDFPTVGIYKKIKNKYFDRLMRNIRKRFDARLISNYEAMSKITKDKENGKLCAYALISDQCPRFDKGKYWTNFMNIKVPVFIGGEVLAKRFDFSVMYLQVEKIKRGFYETTIVPITTDAQNCDDYYIVKTYLRLLEEQIRKKPEHYLWTHKRWKHRNSETPKDATID